MRVLMLACLLFPLLSLGQALKDNHYLNPEMGVSIRFDKSWKVKIPEKNTHLVFAALSRHQTISISIIPLAPGFKAAYTQEEADEAKAMVENGLRAKKTIIKSISLTPGWFQGRKCFILVARLTDSRDEHPVPVYHKNIQLVYRGNLLNIMYNIPLSNLSEMEVMEKQLQTVKLF